MSSIRVNLVGMVWCLLNILISPATAQYNQDLSIAAVTVNGVATTQTWWYPNGSPGPSYTVKSAPPHVTATVTQTRADKPNVMTTVTTTSPVGSIPTLVYNCHYMPYICKGVSDYMNKHSMTFINGVLPLVADLVDITIYAKDAGITLSDNEEEEGKAGKRRSRTCGGSSSLFGKLKYPDGCANWAAKFGATVRSTKGDFAPLGVSGTNPKTGKKIKGDFIPGPSDDEPSFLAWTCDEFPSASWVLGGRGLSPKRGKYSGIDANVICAPQGVSCKKDRLKEMNDILAASVAKGKSVADNSGNLSEQNWQGVVLGALSAALHRLHNPDKSIPHNYVAYFHLSLISTPDIATRAWVITEQGVVGTSQKRNVALGRRSSLQLRDPRLGPLTPDHTSHNASRHDVPSLNIPRLPARSISPRAAFASPDKDVYRLPVGTVDSNAILAAQRLIEKAQLEARESNLRKMAHPRRGDPRKVMGAHRSFLRARELLMTSEELEKRSFDGINATVALPTAADYKPVNNTIKAAAALLAEYAAHNLAKDSNLTASQHIAERASSPYWLEGMRHGKSPFNPTSGYTVFRNVIKDCGAKGDGTTDDTAAIQDCIARQSRCGANCGASSVAGALIYFPAGKYLISSSIQMYYYTQMVGDPTNMPTLLASSSFVGLGVLSSDYYIPNQNGDEWYVNQNNFFRQVRNFNIDLRNVPNGQIAALHWQVAQATSLQNINIYNSLGTTNNVGIFMENGSGGFFSDIIFIGGLIGIQCGNQQFTTRNLVFTNVKTAIAAFWDWGWTWKSLTIQGADTGIRVYPDASNTGGLDQTYSYVFLDSKISANTGILTYPAGNANGITQLTIDNVDFSGSSAAIKDTSGAVVLAGGQKVTSWASGSVVTPASPKGRPISENIQPVRNVPQLLGGRNNGYYERSKPDYRSLASSSFRNALDAGCKGDGVSDDTACLNSLFGTAGTYFLPAGAYLVTDTIRIVPGTIVVGEAWSQIMASGAAFQDAKNPRVVVQVGRQGDTGTVELQDLLFTVKGPTAGAILVEWNIKASAPGSAGMWDCHFRVGGALGSKLQASDCPKLSGSVNSKCIAATMLLHVTSWGSGYFENVWGWVADHDMDSGPAQTQVDIYVARGALIESTAPSWFYGTAMEHAVYYQYQLYGARNLMMGMIQTESPYYQTAPGAPAPFGNYSGFNGDPDFTSCIAQTCAMSWGLRVARSEDVLIYGAGLYSWFQRYDQGCLAYRNCQDSMVSLGVNSRFFLFNLVTVGTKSMVLASGVNLDSSSTLFADLQSNTSSVNGILVQAGTADLGNGNTTNGIINIPRSFFAYMGTTPGVMDPLTVACTPPCAFQPAAVTYPALQPPAFVASWSGAVHTITPPALYNATYTFNPFIWGSYPTGGITTTNSNGNTTTIYAPKQTATITTTDSRGVYVTLTVTRTIDTLSPIISGQVTAFDPVSNQTAIILPPIVTSAPGDSQNTTIYPPPIKIPIPTATDGGNCQPYCGTKPKHPRVIVQIGPGPGPPPPGHRGGSSGGGGGGPKPSPGNSPSPSPGPGTQPTPTPIPDNNTDDDDDDDDDDEEEEEEDDTCAYNNPPTIDLINVPDDNGNTVAGRLGAGSNNGGSVGLGGIDGSGIGYLTDNGTIVATPPEPDTNDNPANSGTGFAGCSSDSDCQSVCPGGSTPICMFGACNCQNKDCSVSGKCMTATATATATVTTDVTITVTSVVTVTPTTTTQTVVPAPTAHADCDWWDHGWGWTFEVYNIVGWATDHGAALHKQEGGCGALTGWSWHDTDDTQWASAYFNLPLFMKGGCVERAIVSAGGPKISCTAHDVNKFTRRHHNVTEENFEPDNTQYLRRKAAGALSRRAQVEADARIRQARSRENKAKRTPTSYNTASDKTVTSTPSYSYGTTSYNHNYTAQNWNGANATLTFTWTFTNTTLTDTWTTTKNVSRISTNSTTTSSTSNSTSTRMTITSSQAASSSGAALPTAPQTSSGAKH